MTTLATQSHDHYSDITLEYAPSSTAVISAGSGRNGTAGVVTIFNATYFILERATYGQAISSLTLCRGIAFNLASLPPSGRCTLLQFMEADDTPQIAITVDSTGIIEAYLGTQAGTLLASAAVPIAVGTYYYLEAGVFIDNLAGTVEVKLWTSASDVTTPINFSGDTQNGGTGALAKVGHGADGDTLTDAIPPSASWDDGYLTDGDFLGNNHFRAYVPDDAGFYTAWVPFPAAPNFGNVDEVPPDLDTTYNFAPDSTSVVSPSLRSVASSANSPTCAAPAGMVAGDLLFVALRLNGVSAIPNPNVGFYDFGVIWPPMIDAATHTHNFDPEAIVNPSASDGKWSGTVSWKIATASEPASYTFLEESGSPLEDPIEIVMVCYEGVNQAVPVDDASIRSQTAPKGATISFVAVDALTDNDLVVAFQFTENETPATPSGYAGNYVGSLINVSSKVNASASGVTVPSTTLGAADTWGSDAYAVKANAVIETGGKDIFEMQDTTSPAATSVMVKLCAKVDVAGHTVGAVMRQASIDSENFGAAPTTDYQIYQFPYPLAPDGGAWTATKFNASEAGYALDAELPPLPPEEAVIFWVDADDLAGTYADGDPITSIVETGIHAYTLSLAHAVSGDYVAQTFQTAVAAVNAQDSIEGFTESLACTPSTRNVGYTNAATNTDLWLPDAFTLVAVVNISQLEGCWAVGTPVIITRRGTDGGGDFAGWSLELAKVGGDPGATATLFFQRHDSSFVALCTVATASGAIAESTTYIVTVICDGTTLKLRIDGVEVDSTPYVIDIEPIANDLWFLNNGDGIGPPQGQTPYTKIWSIELQPADLAAEEAALALKYQ